MYRIALVISLFLVMCFVVAAAAAGATKEDLSACKLPNGLTVMPERDSPGAGTVGGYIFSFTSLRFARIPAGLKGGRLGAIAEAFERMRREKTGDLMYFSGEGGGLLAISGKISELGEHHLYEFDGKELPKPTAVWSATERSGAGEATPGAIEAVGEGHCVLVEAVDGKFALVRLVAKLDRAGLVQWVYQPDGSTRFAIPKGEVTPYEQSRRPAPMLPQSGAPMPDEVVRAKEHVAQRAAVIEALRKLVAQTPATQEQMGAKVEAIKLLGQLRAGEAAPDLVAQILCEDPYCRSSDEIPEEQFPAAKALLAVGKPGSLAALDAIERLGPVPPMRVDREPQMRLFLLTLVVLRVEGHPVAQFMMDRRLEKATGEAKASLQRGLEELAKFGD
jgi:hypothetical protein